MSEFLGYIYISYSPFKKEILPFATTWMHLEVMMLNEIMLDPEKYCMTSQNNKKYSKAQLDIATVVTMVRQSEEDCRDVIHRQSSRHTDERV